MVSSYVLHYISVWIEAEWENNKLTSLSLLSPFPHTLHMCVNEFGGKVVSSYARRRIRCEIGGGSILMPCHVPIMHHIYILIYDLVII